LTTESIFSESAPQIKALDRNLSAFTTLFPPGKSWDNVRSTAVPYTKSRLTRSVANERVGFPVVEQTAIGFLFFIFDLEYLIRVQSSDFLHAKMHPTSCLFVLKLRSFSPNCAPKMHERHQLVCGLLLVKKKFQHPAIQTKIDEHYGGFFIK
jgi:hypothetical protein